MDVWLHRIISLGVETGGSETGVVAVEKRKHLIMPGLACHFLAIHPIAQCYYCSIPAKKNYRDISDFLQ